MRSRALWFVALALVVALAPGADARAQEQPDVQTERAPVPTRRGGGTEIELAAHGAYASPPIRGATTPLGAGLGGRAGLVFSHVYLGGAATYFFGGSDVGATEHAIVYGLELGYDIPLGDALTLRPLVSGGAAALSRTDPSATTTPSGRSGRGGGVDVVSSASGGAGGTTVTSFYVAPALSMLVWLGKSAFLDLDGTVLFAPNVTYSDGSVTSWLSFGARAALGARF